LESVGARAAFRAVNLLRLGLWLVGLPLVAIVYGPLRATAGDCHEMALQGLPPGMFLCATYESLTLRLERGDSIAFFSDGLSDTKNHAEDFFGKERICVVCSSMLRATPQEQLNAITSAVKTHAEGETQQDDLTIAVLYYKPSWRTGNEGRNSN